MARNYVYPVRWIGTQFGGGDPSKMPSPHDYDRIKRSLEWELQSCTRQRSFAICNPNQRVGAAWIGLLVDTLRSEIAAVFDEDCYTRQSGVSGELYNEVWTEWCGMVVRANRERQYGHKKIPRRPDLHRRRPGGLDGSYGEAIGYLRFAGVVVHKHASAGQACRAADLAKELGVPYLGRVGSFRPGKYIGGR